MSLPQKCQSSQPIGAQRVFSRGRAKIQHKVVNCCVNEIEPADGQGHLSIILNCKSALKLSQGYHHSFHQEFTGVPQGLTEHQPLKVLVTLHKNLMISSLFSQPLRTLHQFQPERPLLHCSARFNKGQHANPYRQPRLRIRISFRLSFYSCLSCIIKPQ